MGLLIHNQTFERTGDQDHTAEILLTTTSFIKRSWAFQSNNDRLDPQTILSGCQANTGERSQIACRLCPHQVVSSLSGHRMENQSKFLTAAHMTDLLRGLEACPFVYFPKLFYQFLLLCSFFLIFQYYIFGIFLKFLYGYFYLN